MKRSIYFLLFLMIPYFLTAEDPVVSIYDEFDDGLFGKSIHRGVIVSVKKEAFTRAETFKVKNDDEEGYLTAVVMSKDNAEKLQKGYFQLNNKTAGEHTVYIYSREGLHIEFSIEKANTKLIDIVSDYYRNDELWHDPLVEYYRENYVIRIHAAENVFDSWSDEITYNEAIVAATLIGDSDQWLWGIHDGSDILNKGY